MLQNALLAKVLQHPQQLAVADVEGLGQAADVGNALAVVGILEGQRHPLFQRHLRRGGHGAVELGRQAGAEIPQEGRQPEISGESALYAMRAVFASIESSQTGKTVETETRGRKVRFVATCFIPAEQKKAVNLENEHILQKNQPIGSGKSGL